MSSNLRPPEASEYERKVYQDGFTGLEPIQSLLHRTISAEADFASSRLHSLVNLQKVKQEHCSKPTGHIFTVKPAHQGIVYHHVSHFAYSAAHPTQCPTWCSWTKSITSRLTLLSVFASSYTHFYIDSINTQTTRLLECGHLCHLNAIRQAHTPHWHYDRKSSAAATSAQPYVSKSWPSTHLGVVHAHTRHTLTATVHSCGELGRHNVAKSAEPWWTVLHCPISNCGQQRACRPDKRTTATTSLLLPLQVIKRCGWIQHIIALAQK